MIENTTKRGWSARAWILLILLPLLAGILVSLLIRQPIIGVIRLDDAIYSYTASDMIAQIDHARENRQVKAVVLVLNTPGGTVTDTESVYLELAKLRKVKPVLTMIEGMAASGGYYLSAGTDYIMAKPSSSVGNIGVIGYVPPAPMVFEDVYSTGPYKMWGSPQETFIREMEMLKQGFLEAVLLGRGDRLKVGPEVILRGQIWPGAEALRMGLIDALGSQSDAYEQAAKIARVRHYRVEDLRSLAGLPEQTFYPFFFINENGIKTNYPVEAGIYLLYLPAEEVQP